MSDSFNPARSLATDTFKATLARFHGVPGVSEKRFAGYWFQLMTQAPRCFAAGWYVPPENGLAVIAGPASSKSRISFNSLRDPESWPSDEIIDWDNGCLFAYCSPLDMMSGLPGDFAITLYFGKSKAVREHFLNASMATSEVLSKVYADQISRDLFKAADEIFSKASLKNEVISITDSTPLDLGHSLPVVDLSDHEGRELKQSDREIVSRGRKFLNGVSEWRIGDQRQVTIEPQLRSISDPELPQVTFHYVINFSPMTVLREQEEILLQFGLMP